MQQGAVDNSRVFVIVPSYNEATVIATTLQPLVQNGYSVVLVDDASTDNTAEAVQHLPVYYIKHDINLGQGAAIQTGLAFALQQNAWCAVTFDADGQHDYQQIPDLLKPLLQHEADVVMGSRFIKTESRKEIPPIRRLVLRTAIVINGLLTGLWLTDAHNGFRALNRKAMQAIHLHENRMAHATEILSQIKQAKLRYMEVPVHIVYTEYSKMKGQSSLNSVHILMDLLLQKLLR